MCLLNPHANATHAAAAFHIECPRLSPEKALPLTVSADGWTVSTPASHRNDGAGMVHGAPDEQAYLVPTSNHAIKRGKTAIIVTRWAFSLPHSYETWLYCAYGPVEMARRIPVNATECVATDERRGSERLPTIFDCR